MGDISAEPSMEEILSSIKRIIAEEGDAATGARARRAREIPSEEIGQGQAGEAADREVFELREAVAGEPTERSAAPATGAAPEPILSQQAMEATRQPLEALSRIIVKPEVAGSDTLEGLVREMLKPMLRDWLDANLPQIVEAMVAREISRITSGR
jgi:cell pole-organizing protein PopZ